MNKDKDPAFLFYSKDFYEGTRTLLPCERACYVDLMIYQHQHGMVHDDIKRILMYCNGIEEATLKATLKAKFKQVNGGFINEKLQKIILERRMYSEKQSINGLVGQFWKKSKEILTKKEYNLLKKYFTKKTNNEILKEIKGVETTKASLKALLKHLEDENVIENEDISEEEIEIIYPFDSENFKKFWLIWKNYKRKEFKFYYKSEESEQGALTRLGRLSNNNEEIAILIIIQSIENGWKGHFELQKNELDRKSSLENLKIKIANNYLNYE